MTALKWAHGMAPALACMGREREEPEQSAWRLKVELDQRATRPQWRRVKRVEHWKQGHRVGRGSLKQ
jgi:hypothetical protein